MNPIRKRAEDAQRYAAVSGSIDEPDRAVYVIEVLDWHQPWASE
jgi:hypothetical protein